MNKVTTRGGVGVGVPRHVPLLPLPIIRHPTDRTNRSAKTPCWGAFDVLVWVEHASTSSLQSVASSIAILRSPDPSSFCPVPASQSGARPHGFLSGTCRPVGCPHGSTPVPSVRHTTTGVARRCLVPVPAPARRRDPG